MKWISVLFLGGFGMCTIGILAENPWIGSLLPAVGGFGIGIGLFLLTISSSNAKQG